MAKKSIIPGLSLVGKELLGYHLQKKITKVTGISNCKIWSSKDR